MRIVMTTDCVGGVWSYSMELCRALSRYGCDIHLACLGGDAGDARRAEAAALRNVTLHESSLRLEWMEEPWEDVGRTSEWLRSLLRDTRADLLHLNCFGPGMYRYDVPVLLVAHSCVHSWWRAARGGDPDESWARYRECVIGALCRADCVIAPTRASLAATADCYEEVNLQGRAHVILNGVEAAPWIGDREPGAPVVLAVGRVWDEAKNLGRLVSVAPSLPCPVTIAGAGTLPADATNVVPLGALPRARLARLYRRASVFAHPARYEPFGLAVLEAALCGCPLVLADIPPLRELWHAAARFVEPDDEEGWRRALGDVLGDPDLRRRLARAARDRARYYSAARMAAGYVARYRQLLALEAEDVA